jgi:hypothetical protein
LTDIHRYRAVYFPPGEKRHLLDRYPYLQNLGKRLNLPTGAFLVATAGKK